jgi:hypothetical protein
MQQNVELCAVADERRTGRMPAMRRESPPQLPLDLVDPIQRHVRSLPRRRQDRARAPVEHNSDAQMEMRMVPPEAQPVRQVPLLTRLGEIASAPPPSSFVAWLLKQHKQPGTLGDLAKAARLDPLFPKAGNVENVRAHFSTVGADGDAFEALDYAERQFDAVAS